MRPPPDTSEDDARFLAELDRRLTECVPKVDAALDRKFASIRPSYVYGCMRGPPAIAMTGHERALLPWAELPAGQSDADDLRRDFAFTAIAYDKLDPGKDGILRLLAVARATDVTAPHAAVGTPEASIDDKLAVALVIVPTEVHGLFDALVDLIDHHPSILFRQAILYPFVRWGWYASPQRVAVAARYAALEDDSPMQHAGLGALSLPPNVPPDTEEAACAALEHELASPVPKIPLTAASSMVNMCGSRRDALVAWLEKTEPTLGPASGEITDLGALCRTAVKPRVVALLQRIAKAPARGKRLRIDALQSLCECTPYDRFLDRFVHDQDPDIRQAAQYYFVHEN